MGEILLFIGTCSVTSDLEQALAKDDLDTPKKRQKMAQLLAISTVTYTYASSRNCIKVDIHGANTLPHMNLKVSERPNSLPGPESLVGYWLPCTQRRRARPLPL